MKILVYKLIIVINIGFKLQKSCKASLEHFAAFFLFISFSKITVSVFFQISNMVQTFPLSFCSHMFLSNLQELFV